MKFTYIKDDDREEVIVYCKNKNKLVTEIENLCNQSENKLYGYNDKIIKELDSINIECFFTYDDKVYALCGNTRYLIKKRLYELHELLSNDFVYINQGCLANIRQIDRFDASIGGTLLVYFKSGYKDYVSRRQLKNIKERLGL